MDIGQRELSIRHSTVNKSQSIRHNATDTIDIVFDKSIFLNVFHKDIRRVYIYKKAERLANALYLISPAFRDSVSLKSRVETIALALTEAASMPSRDLQSSLSRELLALSSVLTVARTGGLLSPMNTDLITGEAHTLLSEVAAYEEPRLSLVESPTIATLARRTPMESPRVGKVLPRVKKDIQGHTSTRQESILSLIKDKGEVSIKDIGLVVRDVSDKTIQRELLSLIETGHISKKGERRWSTYSLASIANTA